MAGLEEGLLSSILSPDGTGLAVTSRSLQKSVRSNDRLYRYGDIKEDSISEGALSEVLGSIERGAEEYSSGDTGGHREHSRHDQVRDINWGMTILANSIKVVSAVLTILSVDQTDRCVIEYRINSVCVSFHSLKCLNIDDNSHD